MLSPLHGSTVRICTNLAASALCCIALARCGNSAYFQDGQTFAGPKPDYRRIIKQNLRPLADKPAPTLKNPDTLGPLEISDVRWVQHHTAGWVWLACVKAHPAGRPSIEFAFFIDRNSVVDVRTAILADHCQQQVYQPLSPIKTTTTLPSIGHAPHTLPSDTPRPQSNRY
jgi:hypothetical protein